MLAKKNLHKRGGAVNQGGRNDPKMTSAESHLKGSRFGVLSSNEDTGNSLNPEVSFK